MRWLSYWKAWTLQLRHKTQFWPNVLWNLVRVAHQNERKVTKMQLWLVLLLNTCCQKTNLVIPPFFPPLPAPIQWPLHQSRRERKFSSCLQTVMCPSSKQWSISLLRQIMVHQNPRMSLWFPLKIRFHHQKVQTTLKRSRLPKKEVVGKCVPHHAKRLQYSISKNLRMAQQNRHWCHYARLH